MADDQLQNLVLKRAEDDKALRGLPHVNGHVEVPSGGQEMSPPCC